MDFRKEIERRILIGDGATGTQLYSFGIDSCFEELNILKPDQIELIHQSYKDAGADIIQSNTYGANRFKLKRYDLEADVGTINKRGMQIAKKIAGTDSFAFATIGAIRGFRKSELSLVQIQSIFREQLFALLEENPDGLLLETYYDLDELLTVIEIAKSETDLPIIANLSLHETAHLQNGMHIKQALLKVEETGVDAVGINCRLGPYHMIRSLEEVPIFEHAYLSVYPNASLPDVSDGRFVYATNADYFETSARGLRDQGARIIGGCCGTTPEHIRAIKRGIGQLSPIKVKNHKLPMVELATPNRLSRENHLFEKVRNERIVLAEFDPPKKLGLDAFLKGSQYLLDCGADTITLADNSLASPRISNMAVSSILKQDLGISPLVHITCRDRNLIGLQSHLMGLHTLGINEVLAVTGDPSKIGDFPGATSVYDLSSIDLIALIKQFNDGLSYSGKSLGSQTNFSVAAAFNPNVKYLDKAIQRMERKVKAGADYFLTQPVFSIEKMEEIYNATKNLGKPVFLGIMPLTSSRNAEFLHNEVPGITLPRKVRDAMERAGNDYEAAELESISISKELLDAAVEWFNGIYIMTPFMRYRLSGSLVQYAKQSIAVESREVFSNENGYN